MNWRTENVCLYAITAVLVLGLYWLSGSWHSLWALAMLALVNFRSVRND